MAGQGSGVSVLRRQRTVDDLLLVRRIHSVVVGSDHRAGVIVQIQRRILQGIGDTEGCE